MTDLLPALKGEAFGCEATPTAVSDEPLHFLSIPPLPTTGGITVPPRVKPREVKNFQTVNFIKVENIDILGVKNGW